jgi:hypothetical protein
VYITQQLAAWVLYWYFRLDNCLELFALLQAAIGAAGMYQVQRQVHRLSECHYIINLCVDCFATVTPVLGMLLAQTVFVFD